MLSGVARSTATSIPSTRMLAWMSSPLTIVIVPDALRLMGERSVARMGMRTSCHRP